MKNMSKTLVYFGNERLVSGLKTTSAPILNALIDNGYTIAAVVSHHTDGQSRSNRELEVSEVANKHGIKVLLPDKPDTIIDQLKKLGAEAAILVAYGKIIPQSVIDVFPSGIINIHPSLLPKYRGPTPIETAIIDGDSKTGVSLMRLTTGMDEGPVYAQANIELTGSETKFDVYKTVINKSVKLLIDSLPSILDESLLPLAQDTKQATYTKLLTKADSTLNTSLSATECERVIRAHLGFPKTKTIISGHEIIITKAHVSSIGLTALDVRCKDESFLAIDELIAPSGRKMNAQAFLNGYAAT